MQAGHIVGNEGHDIRVGQAALELQPFRAVFLTASGLVAAHVLVPLTSPALLLEHLLDVGPLALGAVAVVVIAGERLAALFPANELSEEQLGENVYYSYDREGKLLYVNEGPLGRGFKICLTCGLSLPLKATKCTGTFRGRPCPGTRFEVVTLGHTQQTDTLHLRFASSPDVYLPPSTDASFWLSLMYALLHGASRALQIERRDMDGVLFPRGVDGERWEQTIVLFDNVPGGAGHVKRIRDEFPAVLAEAARIANCAECAPDTSCHHCLRDYGNQVYWPVLKRGDVARFLQALAAALQPFEAGLPGETRVMAIDPTRWLVRQAEVASQELVVAATAISLAAPIGENRNWLDVLHELLQRGVATHLFIVERPGEDPASLSVARHLQVMMERGLMVSVINQLPPWHIIIDAHDPGRCRAIRAAGDAPFVLGEDAGKGGLASTIHSEGVRAARAEFDALVARPLTVEELDPPPDVRVINFRPTPHQKVSEADLFTDVFASPVKRLLVHDPYLLDRERICNRLGAYVEMAAAHGQLERVDVITKRAGQAGAGGSPQEQDAAKARVNQRFGGVVHFVHDPKRVGHDRYVEIERANGERARILNDVQPVEVEDSRFEVRANP